MPKLYLLLLAGVLAVPAAQAQTAISIVSTDMPVPGDTLRLSQAATLPAGAPALTLNGANKTWNYAGLVPVQQRVATYKTVAQVATGLQALAFGILGGVNQATEGSPQTLNLGTSGLPISDGKEFYKLSAADFRSVGFGATVGGNAIPVTYASQAQQDVIYHLPQAYGNAPDASDSYFTATAAGVGYLSRRRHRSNQPDAWGTITTPFGTFQALRIVTTLNDHDSVAIGATPGQGVTVPTTKEYKWLAKTIHVPILTITTTTSAAGVETVSGVEYRDIYRHITNPLATSNAALQAGLACYPSPSAPGESLRLTVQATAEAFSVAGYDAVGKLLFSKRFAGSPGEVVLDAATLGSHRGLLLLTVQTAQGAATLRTVRQ